MKKIIFVVLVSVYLWANGLSNKPIPSSIDRVKDLAMMEMAYTNKYKDKKALKEKIKTYPSPIEISKMFVKAYLKSDNATMLKIAPKEILDKLKKSDSKVRDIFTRIEKYDTVAFIDIKGQTVPMKEKLGEKTVYLHIKNETKPLKFGFIWVDDRWILVRLI